MFRLHNVLDNYLKEMFRKLGRLVGRHPLIFLIIPMIMFFVLSTGMFQVEYLSDPDHLLTPVNGEGRKEKAIAEKYFPTNFSDFDAPRSTKFGLYGYVMVTAKSGNSILQPQIWSEVKSLQDIIVNMKIEHEGRDYQYEDICAKWNGQCYTNSLLTFADTFAVLSKGVFKDSVENYYRNYSENLNFEVANNITRLSLETSKDIINNVERIKMLGNKTLDTIRTNLDVISNALDGFSDLTNDLVSKYKIHLEPSFVGINLPAYFGGITLQNRSIEQFDICEVISFLRGDRNDTSPIPCTHPVEIYSAITDFYQHTEKEVFSSKIIADKLNRELKQAIQKLNFRQSASEFLGLLTNVSYSLEDFAERVENLVRESNTTIDINSMVEAEAVLIGGLLDSDMYPVVGEKWENEFLRIINEVAPNFTTISVAPLVSNSLKFEMHASVRMIKPILTINTLGMIIFCMAICFTKDITTSKPWVGFAGVVSTMMASFAAYGGLVYVGAAFTNFNYGAIFVLIGVGLDNSFVILNSWHRTDRKADVQTRLGDTLAEAGVSILITSLTDIISFYTAILAPYPYVQIFCLYTGTSLLVNLIYQVTFFTACLAISGMFEEQRRSGLTFRVIPEESRYQSCLCLKMAKYEVSSKSQVEKRAKAIKRENLIVGLLGKLLRSGPFRITIFFIYVAYLAVSIYGILNVVVYFDRTKLINHDSSMKMFVDVEDKLFRDKAYSISLIISGDVNYTDPVTIKKIDDLVEALENSTYINEHLSKSWLHDFRTVHQAQAFIQNTTKQAWMTEQEFVQEVYSFYENSSSQYRLDVAYDDNRTKIIASRFLIQGQNVHNSIDEENLVLEIREICKKFNNDSMKAHVFNSYFPYTDQYLTIFAQSLQCILFTGVIVISVSIVLLPDIVSAVCAVLSIVSTLTGCLGFMAIWNIVLDGITLINLIMCIGFSVDFSAHFCYHYIDLKNRAGNNRDDTVERTLYSVSKPVIQGGITTLLGVVGMIYAPSEAFVIFFKMIFVVITLGVFHSLVLVPTFLTFILDLIKFISISSRSSKSSFSVGSSFNDSDSESYTGSSETGSMSEVNCKNEKGHLNLGFNEDSLDTISHM